MNIKEQYYKISDKCYQHSKTCKKCNHPIMDDEGNPQFISEACSKGAELLKEFNRLEKLVFSI